MTTDAVARLREQVRRLERRSLPHSHADTLPTGHSAVDDHLGGGLKTGSLHDFLISDPLETGASLAMLLPILKEGRGPVFWISDTPAELNACGLHQSGVSLDHLVCIETDPASLLSAAEDILRGPEHALAVIAGRHAPTLKEIRRLNLAVEASGNTGFFLRSAPLAQAPGKDPCACATRWRLLSHPSSPQTLPGLAMPRPGSRR
ncbi:ImuA family protein, partial [Gluconobacter albidus]